LYEISEEIKSKLDLGFTAGSHDGKRWARELPCAKSTGRREAPQRNLRRFTLQQRPQGGLTFNIKRTRAKPKSRLLTIELTEKGINMLEIGQESKSIDEILSVLTEEERQQMSYCLDKIIVRVKKRRAWLVREPIYFEDRLEGLI